MPEAHQERAALPTGPDPIPASCEGGCGATVDLRESRSVFGVKMMPGFYCVACTEGLVREGLQDAKRDDGRPIARRTYEGWLIAGGYAADLLDG